MKLLVIEDDDETGQFIKNGLVQAGHKVDLTDNGQDGLYLATTGNFDLIVIDRMLPLVDGLTIVRTLRASDNRIPIVVLSALGEIDHRVAGLNAGADDYLVKPFAFSELEARVGALLRRVTPEGPETSLCVGDLEMNLITRKVGRNGKSIDLQPREFRLLEYLMRHAGQVLTRTMLLEHVWDYHFDPQTNVIDVHVSRLRSKIDKGFEVQLLHTVRGAGYKLASL
ncbi:MAG: response regulator transcription factor [Gammaproteobacteria bacterium]|nr:response regulator transcription factor [Gammaproteobacteria bacterium]